VRERVIGFSTKCLIEFDKSGDKIYDANKNVEKELAEISDIIDKTKSQSP
jgi:hypothetical protein